MRSGGAAHQHREADDLRQGQQPRAAGAALHLPHLQHLAGRHDQRDPRGAEGSASVLLALGRADATRTRCRSTASSPPTCAATASARKASTSSPRWRGSRRSRSARSTTTPSSPSSATSRPSPRPGTNDATARRSSTSTAPASTRTRTTSRSAAPNESDNKNYGAASAARSSATRPSSSPPTSGSPSSARVGRPPPCREADFRARELRALGDPDRRSRRPGCPSPATSSRRAASTRWRQAPRRATSRRRTRACATPLLHRRHRDQSNQFDVRLDHNFSPGTRSSSRFSWQGRGADVADDLPEPRAADRREAEPHRNLVVSDNLAVTRDPAERARFGYTHVRPQSFTHRPERPGRRQPTSGLTLLSTNPARRDRHAVVDIAGYTRFGESQEEPLTQDTCRSATTSPGSRAGTRSRAASTSAATTGRAR